MTEFLGFPGPEAIDFKAPERKKEEEVSPQPEIRKDGEAPRQPEKKEAGKEFQPVIPRGWTFLKHGSNLINWPENTPLTEATFTVTRPLSVVEQQDSLRSRQADGGYDTTRNYSSLVKKPEGMTEEEFARKNHPFEIRVVFYRNHPRSSVDPEYRAKLDPKTMEQIGRWYFANAQMGRHPLVPTGEVLVKLGVTTEGGRDVVYCVPESVKDAYQKESGVTI